MSTGDRARCEGLGVRRGARWVLRGVDLTVRDGERWALLGPNGAGKSTLLRAMAGLEPAREGRVWLDGALVGARAPGDRATRVAWVAQQDAAPDGVSVEAFVALGRAPYTRWHGGLSADDRAVVREAMRWAGIEAFAARAVAALSGGERRRVTLARAHAQRAPLWLLDEPTASLDPRQQAWVVDAVASREAGAVVMAVHDPAMALRCCTHAAVLRDGAWIASGAVEQVVTEEILARAFDVPARVGRDPERGLPYVVFGPAVVEPTGAPRGAEGVTTGPKGARESVSSARTEGENAVRSRIP
jgi:iron complex transport system ATP-binding protein